MKNPFIFRRMPRRSFIKISALWGSAAALGIASSPAWAVKKPSGVDYDAVVIGSGLGGLTFAGYMAKAGFRVLVLEQHNVPGGYATTFTRDGGRFSFDVSLHYTTLGLSMRGMLQDLDILKNVKFVNNSTVFRQIAPGRDITCPAGDPYAFGRLLADLYPQERKGIEAFTSEMLGLNEEVERLFKGGELSVVGKATFPMRFPLMWAARKKSLADYLNEHITNPALKSALSVYCGSHGLPPEKLSGFYYMNATGSHFRYGGSYPVGGSQALSNAIVDFIERGGGEVRFETRVDKVIVKDRKAVGVRTSSGETIRAGAVVANCSAIPLFRDMIPEEDLPSDYLKKIHSYNPSISTFLIWLALNRDITDQLTDAHVFLSEEPDVDTAFRYARHANADKCNFGVCIYNNIYKDYSPPGTTVLTLTTLSGYDPWKPFEEDYRRGEKKAYHAKKNEMTQTLLRRLEKALIPGLSKMIAVQDAATPLTNNRFTLNTAGAIYGFEQTVNNSFMHRISNRTPMPGLYLASAWGEPGGGYVGVMLSGKKTFGLLMEDWGKA